MPSLICISTAVRGKVDKGKERGRKQECRHAYASYEADSTNVMSVDKVIAERISHMNHCYLEKTG